MTEYEMAELVNSGMSNMLTGTGIYFAQLASYLAVAYLVGSKLTKYQASFLSALLILLSFVGMANLVGVLRKNMALVDELRKIGSVTVGTNETENAVVISIFIAFRVLILVGALTFMWRVRHPKNE